MEGEANFFEIMKMVLFWMSPLVFAAGIVLVLYSNYKRLEELFGKQVFGVQYRLIPALEKSIYHFHEWLLERRTVIGLICVIFSIVVFFLFKS